MPKPPSTFRFEVRNKRTGKIMKRFKSNRDAVKYLRGLRQPGNHEINEREKKSYNFNPIGNDPFDIHANTPLVFDPLSGGTSVIGNSIIGQNPGGELFPGGGVIGGGGTDGLQPVPPGGGGSITPIPPSNTPPNTGGGTVTGPPIVPNPPNTPTPPSLPLPDAILPEGYTPGNNSNSTETTSTSTTTENKWWDLNDDGDFGVLEGSVVGGIAVGTALTIDGIRKKEKSLVGRIFNASLELADTVWFQYESQFGSMSNSEKEVQKDLLRRDFARNGPLFRAYQKSDLTLNPSRTGWLPFGIEYTVANFVADPRSKKKKSDYYGAGFVRPSKIIEKYWYDVKNDRIYSDDEFKLKNSKGEYARQEKAKIDDGSGKMVNGFRAVGLDGKTVELFPLKPNQVIPSLDITAKERQTGIIEVSSIVDPDTNDEIEALKRELQEEERKLRSLTGAVTATKTIDPAVEKERIKKMQELQAKRDLEAKTRREAAEASRKEQQLRKEAQQKLFLETAQAKLGTEIPDELVDTIRYQNDKEWVEKWIRSGAGGLIPSEAIEQFKYVSRIDGREGGPAPHELIVTWREDFAIQRGLFPDITRDERWNREDLIGVGAIPPKYGLGRTPVFSGGRPAWVGRATVSPTITPSSSSLSSLTTKVAPYARRISDYARNINGDRFSILASKNNYRFNRNSADALARLARRSGKTARVKRLGQGKFGVYVGPNRKRQ